MARSKNKSFSGYKEQHIPKPKLHIPKVYKVNGYYMVGEHNAKALEELGVKVVEVSNGDK